MKKTKIWSMFLCIVLMLTAVVVLTGCGGGGSESSADAAGQGEEDAGPGVVTSSNGIISIENTENYEPQISSGSEKVTLWRIGREEGENDHFVEVEAASTDGSIISAATVCKSYVQGAPYSMQALKGDLDAFMGEHPTIYTNPTEITLNGETYIRTECITNGAESYKIFGSVSGRPVIISVCDDRDNEDVQKMLETLRITYS